MNEDYREYQYEAKANGMEPMSLQEWLNWRVAVAKFVVKSEAARRVA